MSSLAASRADNFYYPPEWRPEMGGISKFQGSKGKNQYEQSGVIRFELPFDAWCLKCKRHMSKGLRFNAKKDKVGKYFSTTIWAFTTKCYSCDEKFIIKTDPQNNTYDYAEGLRKQELDYQPEDAEGTIEIPTDEVRHKTASDVMFRLERTQDAVVKATSAKRRIEDLQTVQEEAYKYDYDMNSLLRSKNRVKRRKEAEALAEGKSKGLNFALLPAEEKDFEESKQVQFRNDRIDKHKVNEQNKMRDVWSSSILPGKNHPDKRPAGSAKLSPSALKLFTKLQSKQPSK